MRLRRSGLWFVCAVMLCACPSGPVKVPNSQLEHTGILVIDAQKLFIPSEEAYFPKYTPKEDITPVLDNLEQLIRLADRQDLPLFLTFELSNEGDSALADRLKKALPTGKYRSWVKSFFNATAHPEFARMVRESGVKRMVVGGAETDVCVLQTVLGLLAMGIEVDLLEDAVFTNELNDEPALWRMEQAGARLISFHEFRQATLEERLLRVESRYMETHVNTPTPVLLEPGKVALVALEVLDNANPVESGKKDAILQRLQQAMFAPHIFDVPLFMLVEPSLQEVLQSFGIPDSEADDLSGLSKSSIDIPQLVEELQKTDIQQVVVLGINQEGSLPRAAKDLKAAGFQTFLMEDATLSRGGRPTLEEGLTSAYQAGVIPLTYKSFYYGMTKAADQNDWPSQEWLARLRELSAKEIGLVRVYDLLPFQ